MNPVFAGITVLVSTQFRGTRLERSVKLVYDQARGKFGVEEGGLAGQPLALAYDIVELVHGEGFNEKGHLRVHGNHLRHGLHMVVYVGHPVRQQVAKDRLQDLLLQYPRLRDS